MPLDDILAKHGNRKNSLIPILQGIQKEHRYLPREVLHEVCETSLHTRPTIVLIGTFSRAKMLAEPIFTHNVSFCACYHTV
jgi:NADH:ubiquinone oxidoreductase subunit E